MVTIDSSGAFIVGAICPTPAAAETAAAAGAHFLVLTPGSDAADKRRFAGLPERLGLPVFIGWFPDARSLGPARASGAHGCAIGPATAR
jgi:hypothetical protein